MPRWLIPVALLSAVGLPATEPANILGLFPYKGASHFYVFRPLLEELARRGHNLTVVSHLPRKERLANYTDISLVDPTDPTHGFGNFVLFEQFETNFYTQIVGLRQLGGTYEKALSNPQVLALANENFDLVITEMFNSDIFFGLTYKIGAPVIGFSSCQLLPWSADTMGAPNDLGYVPNQLGGHAPEMDFLHRVLNFIQAWLSRILYRFFIEFNSQAVAESYLGPLPDLADIAANTSLLFLNTHFTLLGQRPLPQSIVEVGGIHVADPKPLPKDLDKTFNDSKGVIYFSMGSVLNGSSMPAYKQEIFVKVLLATGRTILWKRELPLSPEHPNIITRPWFPQRDILAHPKTELFMAHCGILGVNEAVASGLPVICIPMFGDQLTNANFVAYSGIGLKLRYATLTENELRSAVNEILNNKTYAQRASEISAAFRDRPMSALETAVFWTEYLLRHGPRPFVAPFKKMPHWQRIGFDVAAFLIVLVIAIIFITKFCLRVLLNRTKSNKMKQS